MLGLPHWGEMSLSCHPALLFMGGKEATAGQSGTFPQGTGAQTPRVGAFLFCRGREEEQRGVVFLKSLPRALGTGIRREGGERCVCWRISAKGPPAS